MVISVCTVDLIGQEAWSWATPALPLSLDMLRGEISNRSMCRGVPMSMEAQHTQPIEACASMSMSKTS